MKISIFKKLTQLNEDREILQNRDREFRQEKIDVKDSIDQLESLIEENSITLNSLTSENEKSRKLSEKNESEIKSLLTKTDELQQRIELNSVLKDVDIN